jgi:hypothetical protein
VRARQLQEDRGDLEARFGRTGTEDVSSVPYDVTPDGKRFVMVTQKVTNPNTPLTLVVNWTARLNNKQ